MISKTGFSIQPKSLYKSHPYSTQPHLQDTLKKEHEDHPKSIKNIEYMLHRTIQQQNHSQQLSSQPINSEPSEKAVLKKYIDVLHPRQNQQGKLIKYRRIMPENSAKTASRGFRQDNLSSSKRKSTQKSRSKNGTLSHRCQQKSPPLNLTLRNDQKRGSRIIYSNREGKRYLQIEDIIFDRKKQNKK